MSNWVKVTNDEFEVGIEIAALKKGELQIKYAKDIVAKDKEIERLCNALNEVIERNSKAIEFIEEHNIIGTNKEYLPSGIEKCYSLELMEILQGSDKK